jgi:hypothetical protein
MFIFHELHKLVDQFTFQLTVIVLVAIRAFNPGCLKILPVAIVAVLQAFSSGIFDDARDVSKAGIAASAGAISYRWLSGIIRPIIQTNPTG